MVASSCIGGLHSTNASAIGLSVEGSSFEYTLITEKVSSNQIKLIFQVLNNPGVNALNFAIVDNDYLTYTGYNTSSRSPLQVSYNEQNNKIFCVYTSTADIGKLVAGTGDGADHDKFTMEFYYTITGNYSSDHEFHFGITAYNSPSEPDAEFSLPIGSTPSDAIVEIKPSVTATIGDINNDGSIATTDAYYVLEMVQRKSGTLTTTYLDQQLQNTSSVWYQNYSFLPCAMVADVNRDATITDADANEILTYRAEVGANQPTTNKYINTVCPVTVVYDNT